MDLHALYVIGGFVAMVLAPVVAATLIGVRTKNKKRESGSHPVAGHPGFQITDPAPPRVNHHLRPKPRRRGPR